MLVLLLFREIWILKFQRVFVCIKFNDLQVLDVAYVYNCCLMISTCWRGHAKGLLWFYSGFNNVSWNLKFRVSEGLRTHFVCNKFCNVKAFDFLLLLFNDIDVLEGSNKNICIILYVVLIVFRGIHMLVFKIVFVCIKFNYLQIVAVLVIQLFSMISMFWRGHTTWF